VASQIETVLGSAAAAARNYACTLISLLGFNRFVKYMNKRITEFKNFWLYKISNRYLLKWCDVLQHIIVLGL
jgi:hypothetical protein